MKIPKSQKPYRWQCHGMMHGPQHLVLFVSDQILYDLGKKKRKEKEIDI